MIPGCYGSRIAWIACFAVGESPSVDPWRWHHYIHSRGSPQDWCHIISGWILSQCGQTLTGLCYASHAILDQAAQLSLWFQSFQFNCHLRWLAGGVPSRSNPCHDELLDVARIGKQYFHRCPLSRFQSVNLCPLNMNHSEIQQCKCQDAKGFSFFAFFGLSSVSPLPPPGLGVSPVGAGTSLIWGMALLAGWSSCTLVVCIFCTSCIAVAGSAPTSTQTSSWEALGYNHKQKNIQKCKVHSNTSQVVSFTRNCSSFTVLILPKWPQFSLTSFALSLQKAKTSQPLRFCTPTYPSAGYVGGARKQTLCQCHSWSTPRSSPRTCTSLRRQLVTKGHDTGNERIHDLHTECLL